MKKEFLGNKVYTFKWVIDRNSVKKITPAKAKEITGAVVELNQYEELVIKVTLTFGVTFFKLDKATTLKVGDTVNPSSIIYYNRVNTEDGTTIKRYNAMKL